MNRGAPDWLLLLFAKQTNTSAASAIPDILQYHYFFEGRPTRHSWCNSNCNTPRRMRDKECAHPRPCATVCGAMPRPLARASHISAR